MKQTPKKSLAPKFKLFSKTLLAIACCFSTAARQQLPAETAPFARLVALRMLLPPVDSMEILLDLASEQTSPTRWPGFWRGIRRKNSPFAGNTTGLWPFSETRKAPVHRYIRIWRGIRKDRLYCEVCCPRKRNNKENVGYDSFFCIYKNTINKISRAEIGRKREKDRG